MNRIVEFTKEDYKILRKGPYYAIYQYKHLLKAVIETLDFLFKDYKDRKNLIFVIPPVLNINFILIKTTIISIENYFSLKTHKKYSISKTIIDLEDNPEKIFQHWTETRDLHINTVEGWENDPRIPNSKFSVDSYVAKLIGESRKELKKLKPARLSLSKLVRDNSKPDTYEIVLAGTTLTVKTSHLGTFILHPNFHFDRVPFRTMEFLLKNSNKKVTKNRLEDENIKSATPLDEQLGKIGFVGNIGKAFISSSNKTAILRNPITTQDIINLGIDQGKLDLEILTLNTAKS